MKTYKYKVVKTNKEVGEEKLNLLGRKGWVLCAANNDNFGYIYYFKKESDE